MIIDLIYYNLILSMQTWLHNIETSFLYLFPLLSNEESNAPAANSTSIFFQLNQLFYTMIVIVWSLKRRWTDILDIGESTQDIGRTDSRRNDP